MYVKKTVGYVLPLSKVEHSHNFNESPGVYIKKMLGYVVANDIEKGLLDVYYPPTGQSHKWKHWVTVIDLKRCFECRSRQGQIFAIHEEPAETPPLHPNCRCKIEVMEAAIAGTATKDGEEGADYWIYLFGELPDNYISKKKAQALGWKRWAGNLHDVAPWKIIGGDRYWNDNGHLPDAPGRIWYEADINYQYGFRNGHRILYSNDGLIFATYDHYWSFIEIEGESI